MKIEDGIEIPPRRGGGAPPKYPFGKMKVGQSIFFPNEEKGSQSTPAMAAYSYARLKGNKIRFEARIEEGGVRIWRVE